MGVEHVFRAGRPLPCTSTLKDLEHTGREADEPEAYRPARRQCNRLLWKNRFSRLKIPVILARLMDGKLFEATAVDEEPRRVSDYGDTSSGLSGVVVSPTTRYIGQGSNEVRVRQGRDEPV